MQRFHMELLLELTAVQVRGLCRYHDARVARCSWVFDHIDILEQRIAISSITTRSCCELHDFAPRFLAVA